MLLPRLAALAEVQWCQPDVKNWDRFFDSADDFCKIYETMGYRYASHIFNASGKANINKEKGCVEVELYAQGGTPVRYTIDGSQPGPDSPLYTEPVEIRESCTLKAINDSDRDDNRIWEKHFAAHKAMGRPVQALTTPHPNYTYNCPDLLTDGIVGVGPYNSGEFAGWYNQPLEVVIEMGCDDYSEVTVSTFILKGDWIFGPKSIALYTSEDGQTYTELAKKVIEDNGHMAEGNGCLDFTLTFDKTSAHYLKVIVETYTELPQWHPGAGHPGFIFVDEIIVR
jgi:hexosaminidase